MAADSITLSPTFNGDTVPLTAGMIVRLKPGANNNVVRAQADSALHVQGVNGVVISGSVSPTGPVTVVCTGRESVQMESGLTPSVGDTVYVSATAAGKGTNVLPANVSAIGTVADISNYARTGTIECDVVISAVTPASVSGVSSVNTTKPGDTVSPSVGAVVISGGGIARVANLTALAALSAVNFPIGNTFCWDDTVGSYYQLQTSALAPTTTTVIPAAGVPSARWLRMNWLNNAMAAQKAWFVNTATGDDEAAGTSGAPLKTLSEVARRLAYATLTNTTVDITGNTSSTDLPVWTFNGGEFCLTISGVPTTLFSGSVTTAVNVSPAPTTTENDLTDTSIPVSFTASGLLANGVLFSFTSGPVGRAFWALQDKGSKTIRISQPYTAFTGSSTFANGETHTAAQLPKIWQNRFLGNVTALSVLWINVVMAAGVVADEPIHYFQNCCFLSAKTTVNAWENCLFQGDGACNGAGSNTLGGAVWNGCCWRGTGAQRYSIYSCPSGQTSGTSSFQGVQLLLNNGAFLTIQADVLSYDVSSPAGTMDVGYWSELLVSLGAFGGSNNAALASVNRLGMIAHVTTPAWVAGSSTATNPITVIGSVGSPFTVAQETAGLGVVNAFQNGIFSTG